MVDGEEDEDGEGSEDEDGRDGEEGDCNLSVELTTAGAKAGMKVGGKALKRVAGLFKNKAASKALGTY